MTPDVDPSPIDRPHLPHAHGSAGDVPGDLEGPVSEDGDVEPGPALQRIGT